MNKSQAIGRRCWVISAGNMPLCSTGAEPLNTSHDMISVLNTGPEDCKFHLTFYYGERDPVGPYELKCRARRVLAFRINDLIDPEAVPLDTDYALVLEATHPVVVQLTRKDTSQAANSVTSLMAFPFG